MPAISLNLGDIQSFESLPFGEYYGEVEKIVYHPAKAADKSPQLRAQYVVIDGDHINRRQSQFFTLSTKAFGFLKAWLMKFGLTDEDEIVIDDENPEEPLNVDLIGSKVIFKIYPDPKDATRIRTEIVSVEESTFLAGLAAPAAAPAPAPAPRRVAAPAPAPVAEEETVDADEAVEAEATEEAEAAPAPAPRRVTPAAAPRPAARPAAAQPARRTLR